ncbi:uncharacterized protein [Hemitrygon akajei]|uniref:uncharacterized protein isoform X3 n=1 Tax=Hemitrygon akajei TaxID=2704970 RepID=UPI003BFA1484
MESCNIHLYFQLSLALFAFVELAVGDEKELTVTVGGVETLSCLISRQLPYDRPVSWYWTAMYPECSGSTGGKILDIYPDGRTVFEEEFKGRVLVYRSRVKKGDYSITIRGIKIPDSGEFICAHEYLSDEKKVRLIVKPGCWSNLYLTVEPPVASIGDKVTLTCTYCGTKLVTPRIKWQYDGLAVSDTGVVSITNGGHSLVISHVDQEHLKKYGCSMAKKESIVTEICLNIVGTHDVEHNASNPNDDVPSSEVPETRDAVQMQSENDDNDAKGSTDGMNAGMQEPNKNEDEDENTSPIEMKEADVKDSSHVEESEDGKLQGDQQ